MATQKIPWIRIGAESVAIVSSILLAFGIHALWDARSNGLSTENLLVALERERTSDLGQLDDRLARLNEVLAATEEVINRDRSGRFNLGSDDGDEWWGRLFFGIYKPSLGALNALLFNYLNNVENIDLRVAIASWQADLAEVAPEASALIEIGQMDFRRQIARVTLDLKVDSSLQSRAEQMNTMLGAPSDILVDAMFKDREVLQALAHGYQISVLYVKQLGDVRTVLAQNLGLLRSEISLE